MSLHFHHHVSDFLKNKEMNSIYISYGILSFALGLISVFVPIYLYELGYSVPWILFYFFLTSLSFVTFSFIGRETDKHNKKRLLKIGMLLYFLGWVGRMAVNNFVSVFFVDIYKSVTRYALYMPCPAYSYDLAAKKQLLQVYHTARSDF